MSTTGELKKTENGYAGFVANLDFDIKIELVKNTRTSSKGRDVPTYSVIGRSPKGRQVELGGAWEKTSEITGNDYLMMPLRIKGQTVLVNAHQREKGDPSELFMTEWSDMNQDTSQVSNQTGAQSPSDGYGQYEQQPETELEDA